MDCKEHCSSVCERCESEEENHVCNTPEPKALTEQCFCKGYSDDNNIIQDCTCGKCDYEPISSPTPKHD